jgi:hypothetical protein
MSTNQRTIWESPKTGFLDSGIYRRRLSLRHADLGSFAMPREWTDWAPPGGQASSGAGSLLVDAFGLVALAELLASFAKNASEG